MRWYDEIEIDTNLDFCFQMIYIRVHKLRVHKLINLEYIRVHKQIFIDIYENHISVSFMRAFFMMNNCLFQLKPSFGTLFR